MVQRIARSVITLALGATLLLASAPLFAATGAKSGAPTAAAATAGDAPWGQKWIESRLIAPCCWTQTVDVHESEVASKMRGQIHTMLVAGKSADEIEDYFAAEYGEAVRAVPKGKDPMSGVALFAGSLVILAAVGLGIFVARMVRRKGGGASAPLPKKTGAGEEALDARIDAELAELD